MWKRRGPIEVGRRPGRVQGVPERAADEHRRTNGRQPAASPTTTTTSVPACQWTADREGHMTRGRPSINRYARTYSGHTAERARALPYSRSCTERSRLCVPRPSLSAAQVNRTRRVASALSCRRALRTGRTGVRGRHRVREPRGCAHVGPRVRSVGRPSDRSTR